MNSLKTIDYELGRVGNHLAEALGMTANVSITRPLYEKMESVDTISIFLDTNMLTLTAFLAILSAQLIYSLMLSDVEERTFEMGMLRALGFNTNNVLVTVLLQSMVFAIPGVVLGMCVAAIMNASIRAAMFYFSQNTLTYGLSKSSIVIGLLVGCVIPVGANILPIRRALGKNLRTSLDLNHRSTGELTVSVTRLSEIGMDVSQAVLAVMLIVLGIACYYVAPVSFLYG